jgi:hypothetical protein
VNKDFTLYFAFANNNWCFPAFRTAHCYNGLMSYYYARETPNLIPRTQGFIKDPESLLAQRPYANNYKLMQDVRAAYR